MNRNNLETMPRFGQSLSFTQGVHSFLDEMAGRENTEAERQGAYARMDEAAGKALLTEAQKQGVSAEQLDEHLALLAGDTSIETEESNPSQGIPTFWK